MASKKKNLLAILVFLLICFQAVYGQEDTIVLQLRWRHQFQFAGYYAAVKKGFYKSEKLQVKIKEYDHKTSAVDEVLSNRAQYGVFGSDIILAYMKGKPLKVLASIFQHSPYAVISVKGKGVFKLTDLAGKKVMAAEMGSIVLKCLLQNEGIPQNSVKIVPYEPALFTKDSTIKAVIGYKSVMPHRLERSGYETVLIEPSDYGVDFYGDVLFTSTEEVTKNPERAERFKRATLKGWDYALEHPDEIIDYILTLPGVTERGVDRDLLKREFLVISDLVKPNLVEIGHTNKGRWEFTLKRFMQLGIIGVYKSVDGLIYEPKDKAFLYIRTLAYVIVVLLVFVLFFSIRSVFIKRNLDLEKRRLQEIDKKSKFNEESIKLILENAGIILWDWDVINDRISVFGMKSMERVYRNVSDFKHALHPDYFSKFDTFLGSMPESFTEEIRMEISGSYKWKLLTIKARKFDGKSLFPVVYTGMLIDISEIKQKEEHLDRLSRELEITNSELEKFAYITSHNIRAPIVNLESLMDFYDFECKDSCANNDIVNKIGISVQRLKDTLEELVKVTSKK